MTIARLVMSQNQTPSWNGLEPLEHRLFLHAAHGVSVEFSLDSYTVQENAGTAMISLTRSGFAGDAFEVSLTAVSGTAASGADFDPGPYLLSFMPGDVTKTFSIVTIVDDNEEEPDESLQLVLSSPTNGASLGARTTANLTILANDDVTPPRVTGITPRAVGKKLGFIELSFDESLDAMSAQDPAPYAITLAGKDKRLGTADDKNVPLASVAYDDSNQSVTLTPTKPLKLGTILRVAIGGESAPTDLQGNLLDGEFSGTWPSGNGIAGGDFMADVALGSKLDYHDAGGDKVQLQLKKGGLISLLMGSDGNAHTITLLDTLPGASMLTGRVVMNKKSPASDGVTPVAALLGMDGVTNLLPDAFIIAVP